MANVALHRDKLVQTAIRLFREKGYAGTGLSEILSESGAPKGSLYYYFPGGKEELAAAALQAAGEVVAETLRKLASETKSPQAFVAAYCALLANWMEASGFKAGCPITTTVLETVPGSEALGRIARDVFSGWNDIIAAVYTAAGMRKKDARERAEFVIAAIEGALIQARVIGSSRPIKRIAQQLSLPS